MEVHSLSLEHWLKLRDLFKKEWPRNILPYNLIQNYIEWNSKNPQFVHENINIYCLNGDWTDGTFFALENHQLFFYSLNDDIDKLSGLLSNLPKNREYLACCIYKRHLPVIEKLVEKMPNWENKFDTLTYLHYLPKEKAGQFDTINNLDSHTIKPLFSNDHIAIVNSVYPFGNGEITTRVFTKLMKFNPHLGIFDNDSNLVAWCFTYQSGVLNALQVIDDGKKRQGFGSLIVKCMAKIFFEKGMDTTGCIVDGNLPSLNLFKKLGFDIIDEVHWLGIGPRDVNGTI
uniref:CSON001614 protein n=1 Tax=Culicoides sonorensis TaxID=179676 RepID=A0A336MI60_CULSO